MVQSLITQAEQLRIITAAQLPWKTGLCKLFKSNITFTPFLLSADFTAIECDFSGYGAVTETTLPAVYPDPVNGGVSFEVPTIQFQCADPATVVNDVFGGWFESSAGLLLMAFLFPTPFPMNAPLVALPLNMILNMYGSNDLKVLIAGDPQ